MRVEHLAEGVVSIYALCESDGRVRYVGKTVHKPSRRLIHHINAARRGRKRPVSEQFTRAGIAAAAAEKLNRAHCKRGHPLSGDNLFMTHGGSRGCKECRKLHKRAYRERTNAVA